MGMFTIRQLVVFVLSWLLITNVVATPISDSAFRSKIDSIYSFEPNKLRKVEMKVKSDQLDQFWSLVKADPENTLPKLRRELANPSNSAFFYYDGSKLLLSLSKEKADKELALRSIPKADINGLQPTDYLKTIHWFAQNGFDTREAAFRILAFPDFQAFIPQHSLTLGQNYSLVYMLFPLDDSVFLTDLVSQLLVERNVQSQKSLILALWYTVTPVANMAILKFIEDSKSPAESREYAKQLLARKGSAFGEIGISKIGSLKDERRRVMQRSISDEALIEFDGITAKLISK